MGDQTENNLTAWIKKISETDMPVFNETARHLSALVQDDSRHRTDITNAILQDAGLTARVLRLANSAFYKQTNRHSLSTITRAVLVLGINEIRNICLTVSMIDVLLKADSKEQLAGEMAKAFYAATIARQLAERRGDETPEEVFVAALLYRLGEMAVWCFGGETAARLEHALGEPGGSKSTAERSVLGFRLTELTAALAERWQLGDLLRESLKPGAEGNSRVKGVVLSNRFAEVAAQGLDASLPQRLAQEMAEYAGVPLANITNLIRVSSAEAAAVAKSYGAVSAARLIPKIRQAEAAAPGAGRKTPAVEAPREVEPPAQEEKIETLEPDPQLQLKILRELTAVLAEEPDVHSVLEIVLEGMYRGIGMDRAFLALLSPDRKHLKVKFALGAERAALSQRFDVEIDAGYPHIFYEVVEKQKTFWVGSGSTRESKIPLPIRAVLGTSHFYVAPTVIAGRSIGAFYADRKTSGRELDADSYESFKLFSQQANLALEAVTKKKGAV